MSAKLEASLVNLNRLTCEVKWSDGHCSRFHGKWLRFNCHCKRCKPEFTGIYLLDQTKFPENLQITKVTFNESELLISYDEEIFHNHVTAIPLDWLRIKCYCDKCLENKLDRSDVITLNNSKTTFKQRTITSMSYKQLAEKTDKEVFKCLSHIVNAGYCLIRDVPTESGMCVKIAKLVGDYVEPSTYGETFEVFARNEMNAAYTNYKLPLHQDQPQYEAAPGIQFLHALRFDSCVTGGESFLVDVFEAVELLRKEYPEDFQSLTEIPGTYKTIDFNSEKPMYFEVQKCHIVLNYFGKVTAINWHPALLGTLQVHEKDVDRYYRAYRNLLKITERPELQYRFRMQPGDMIAFNNRRMLHARTAFQNNGGTRHLQGCYTKLDDMKSRYMTLGKKLGIDVTGPKLGNHSFF